MGFFITDEQVQAAFDVLHSNEHAKTRAAYEYAEKRLKIVLADAVARSEAKTVAERDNEAIRSEEYQEALKAFRMIARAYYEARDKREAASAVLEAHRTQRSDMRAMGRVG
jgi:hypothetical protein